MSTGLVLALRVGLLPSPVSPENVEPSNEESVHG
jgi:hypothetical protein